MSPVVNCDWAKTAGGTARSARRLRKVKTCLDREFLPSNISFDYIRGFRGDVPPDVEFGVAAAPWPA